MGKKWRVAKGRFFSGWWAIRPDSPDSFEPNTRFHTWKEAFDFAFREASRHA